MNSPITIWYDRFDPVKLETPGDIDALLTQIADEEKYLALPVMVAIQSESSPAILRILLGHPTMSLVSWDDETDLLLSSPLIKQPANFAVNLDGRRTLVRDQATISIALAQQAVREFISGEGAMPRCVRWQHPAEQPPKH